MAAPAGVWPARGAGADNPPSAPRPAVDGRPGRTHLVGPLERFHRLADALAAAQDGDTVALQPGDHHGDAAVAVAEGRRLAIVGLGRGARLHAAGRIAEGKAILVVRGDVTVDNIGFAGARAGGNGAGIRFESGRLAVRGCVFVDNENGILTAGDPAMTLTVDDCAFGQAPRHIDLLHHLLYVGTIGSVRVSGSRFANGFRGHLLKSRARRNWVLDNRLDDGPAGEASYELEFPEGGENVVVGNVIVQSQATQNPVMLAMGAEARAVPHGSLTLAHNTFVNFAGGAGRFVRVWTERLAADTSLRIVNNVFAGPGALDLPATWDGGGNARLALSELRDVAGGDYRLAVGSPWQGRALPLPAELTPSRAASSVPSGPDAAGAGGPLPPGALHAD